MDSAPSISLSLVADPLFAAFGPALEFARDGEGVRWSFAGQSAVVDLRDDGSLDARFIALPSADVARGTCGAAVYRPCDRTYALSIAGCERMVADTIAFFSGTREPRFAFVDVL